MDTIAATGFSALSGCYGAITVLDISKNKVWPMSGSVTLIKFHNGEAIVRPYG
jgi:tRNA(Phe) wybutosine-synthesizing methylase Tyw3